MVDAKMIGEGKMQVDRFPVTDRESWLKQRASNINASEIGALFDCHPHTTRLKLWLEKSGRIEPKPFDNGVMRRGRILENAVAIAAGEDRPEWTITEAKTYYSSSNLRMGATPDFFVTQEDGSSLIVLQAKTCAPHVFDDEWGARPPKWIVIQNAVELMLTDAGTGAIAALVVDPFKLPIHIYDVPRRKDVEDAIALRVARFWDMVEKGIQPKPGAKDAEPLKRLFPNSDADRVLDMSGDSWFREFCEKYLGLKAQERAIKAELEGMAPDMMAKMEDAQYAIAPGFKATWRTQTRAAYEVKESTFKVFEIRKVKS